MSPTTPKNDLDPLVATPKSAPGGSSSGSGSSSTRGRVAGALVLLLVVIVLVFYVADTRWRVRFQQGVRLPPSARDIDCFGCTRLICWNERALTHCVINSADLPGFLQQFQVGRISLSRDGTWGEQAKPWTGPPRPDGELWGPSPTGRGHCFVKWVSTPAGVHVEIETTGD